MRVIVFNQSDELRQVLQYVFEQGVDADVVAETDDVKTLPQQVDQLKPEWLFLLQDEYKRLTGVVNHLLDVHPDLQVILLSADGKHIRYQQDRNWNTEVDTWSQYSLSEFIYFLTAEDVSPAAVQSFEDIGEEEPPKFVEE